MPVENQVSPAKHCVHGTINELHCSFSIMPIRAENTTATAEIRVLSYNVHSCRGTDGRTDPARIAAVIAACGADVVALQEVDVGRRRTGGVDQAQVIAAELSVRSYFHPALHLEEEKYGDALLTNLPLTMLKSGALPSVGEPRGALLARLMVDGAELIVANTHLGLRRAEKQNQTRTLLGGSWLGNASIAGKPTVFLGDFNAVPRSRTYRQVTQSFQDAQAVPRNRRGATFPSCLPLIRIDHIFVRNGMVPLRSEVLNTRLARAASDHLPVIATLAVPCQQPLDAETRAG